ncbi:hypothetical protein JCM19046_4202 [Bacillus sp. JCM 19046]|nr:hypothetical protein JCM19046_4202 [Bacillus sp. JCM 19046]
MEIKKESTRYYVEGEDNNAIGELEFQSEDDHIVITHTFVDPKARGTGIGADLVAELVNDMRQQNQKIKPVCAFAKAEFDKHQDYQDVAL